MCLINKSKLKHKCGGKKYSKSTKLKILFQFRKRYTFQL